MTGADEQDRPGDIRYSPAQLARVLRMPEPTLEQAAVIGGALGPLAVIAGAGSGKSETMPQKSTFFYPKLTSGLLFHPVG